MSEKWISDCGMADERALAGIAAEYCGQTEKMCCAFYTDHFQASALENAGDQRLEKLLAAGSALLEMRLFDQGSELWLHRSMLGQPFSWRIASDRVLQERCAACPDPFLRNVSAHRMAGIQLLDLDAEGYGPFLRGEEDAFGARKLRTTGGGEYSLPLKAGQDAVIVVSYIRYDRQGVASLADSRLAGFTNEKEWRKNHAGR